MKVSGSDFTRHAPGCRRPRWDLWQTFHHAPAGPAGKQHTTFMVLTCESCKALEIFPRTNWELATAEFREQFKAAAAAAGWRTEDL